MRSINTRGVSFRVAGSILTGDPPKIKKKVWVKIMFLHLSVILFTGVGGISQHVMGRGVYPNMQWGKGVFASGSVHLPGHPPPGGGQTPQTPAPHGHTPPSRHIPPVEMTTETGGTHSTGMYSCLNETLVYKVGDPKWASIPTGNPVCQSCSY